MSMKVLIAYYSHTGNTQKVAEALKAATGADVTRIEPVKDTNYLFKCFNAMRKKRTPIKPCTTDLKDYDAVVVGSPVWASGAPMGVNQYLDELKNAEGKKYAVLVTYGGSGQEKVAGQIKAQLDGKKMSFIGMIDVKQDAAVAGNFQDKVNALAAKLK
jgi:flavodoxin